MCSYCSTNSSVLLLESYTQVFQHRRLVYKSHGLRAEFAIMQSRRGRRKEAITAASGRTCSSAHNKKEDQCCTGSGGV